MSCIAYQTSKFRLARHCYRTVKDRGLRGWQQCHVPDAQANHFDRAVSFLHLRHSFALRLPNAKSGLHSEVPTPEMHHYVANPEKHRLQRLALTGEKLRRTHRFYYFDAFSMAHKPPSDVR